MCLNVIYVLDNPAIICVFKLVIGCRINQKKPSTRGGFSIYQQNVPLLSFSQIGVWSRYRVWTFLTFRSTAQINGSAITTFLAILEDKPVTTNTFFFYQVIDHSIYSIPAELLFLFCRVAVTNNYHLTFRIVAHTGTNTCLQALCVFT